MRSFWPPGSSESWTFEERGLVRVLSMGLMVVEEWERRRIRFGFWISIVKTMNEGHCLGEMGSLIYQEAMFGV